ncbi:hypothetical protein NEFER03_1790 [Nematocida sp. LUAm3]|nr:hypothetical protein NEFER03_1790 [Nematocida sp. LUAm3]KAI5173903.1 hypothetical protein NEFER02_0370 [Nematocida sp. LUAm2]KAI5177352.1 hypothetical protein NEFER01_0627 [Nematocida sp. LUAm1]
MKKKQEKRVIDLLQNIQVIEKEQIEEILSNLTGCITEYNQLMDLYHKKGSISHLFLLIGNHDPSIFHHLPLFAWIHNISLYKVEESISPKANLRIPHLIGIKKGDRRIAKVLHST